MPQNQKDIETIVGHQFKDPSLLKLALTHSSCDQAEGNNQRLEFLGDAVLDLAIAESLYRKFPDADEGALDRGRASLVNGKSLASIADQLDLGPHLTVGDAHRKHHPDPSKAMLEDALEALIGAVFLDGGFEAARNSVNQLLEAPLSKMELHDGNKNPKGRLQEWAQQIHDGAVPRYEELDTEGPDHNRRYGAVVYLNDMELGRGYESSKKAAEAEAAQAALKKVQ